MRLEDLGAQTAQVIEGRTTLLVTDEHVAALYLERAKASLEEAGFSVHTFVVAPGETSKSMETYFALLNHMAEIPLTRTDCAVALGGGVVGDLTGFAAATYLRGIPVIQVPTSLLSMVDSAVGGKTAINLPAGKNLVGAFHMPALVLWDITLLHTLPDAYFKDGMGEVIKYGVLSDAKLFNDLKNPAWAKENLEALVARCVEIKKSFVEQDQFDRGERQKLNLGHTLGHAIERASDFTISHGCAVATGMFLLAKAAAKKGWCKREVVKELEEILKAYDFSLETAYDIPTLCAIMRADKKRKGDTIDLVIPERIGSCTLKRVSLKELEEVLCEL